MSVILLFVFAAAHLKHVFEMQFCAHVPRTGPIQIQRDFHSAGIHNFPIQKLQKSESQSQFICQNGVDSRT